MKEINKKAKILASLIAIVILVGIIVISTIGLNFDLRYQEAKKIQLYLEKNFEISDIKQITDEILPNEKVMIQKVEMFEDTVSILAKDITQEQKNDIINKVNEKYELELSADNIEIATVPHTRGRDIVKPYMVPFAIATILILAYMAIRYYKLGSMKILLETVGLLLVTQAVLLSVMAITRIPMGRLTIPLVLTVYVLTLLGVTTCFERRLEEEKKEEK